MKMSLNILIIEDNESDAALVVRALEKSGYKILFERVETVIDLTSALEKNTWNIVLSDYQLPHLDATKALEIFKSFNIDIPFIVISGTIGEEAAANIIKMGAQNYVMKSNLSKLASIVERELLEAAERKEQKELEEQSFLQQGFAKTSAFGEMAGNFFKSNLQHLLEVNSIKQSQLSRDVGISKQTISDWLKKDSLINIQQALKLTKYFKITVEDLFTCNLKMGGEQDKKSELDFLKQIHAPLYVINFDGSYTSSNQAFCDLLGFSEYDLNSRFFSDLVHPEDIARIKLQMKRVADSKITFSQMDIRFITMKQGFCWINNLCITSLVDKKIFIFASLVPEQTAEELTTDSIPLDKFTMRELERIQGTSTLPKKLLVRSEIDPTIWITTERNIFKCLLRSLFNQFQFIDFESENNYEVLLKSRIEKESVVLSATINCAINPKRLDLSRVQKVANLIRVEISENYAGNIYSFYMEFPKFIVSKN